MRYVDNPSEIPNQDLSKIRARLINQINSMNDAELQIAAASEASLKAFIADIFRSIAQLFGYIVGSVVGYAELIAKGIRRGWQDGFNAGRG